MKQKDLDILRATSKILKREVKKYRCEGYCFMCPGCEIASTMERFESMVMDYLESDEWMKKYFGNTKKKTGP